MTEFSARIDAIEAFMRIKKNFILNLLVLQ